MCPGGAAGALGAGVLHARAQAPTLTLEFGLARVRVYSNLGSSASAYVGLEPRESN